jgi:N-acetylglucosaminyl-diphospho-decaprenol L-rhamnosyltransferase
LQLSIIIINYNVKYFLEQCLCSVTKACVNIDAEILVIDNNSSDGSKDFFTGKFPEARFIWHDENIGFAKANNLALKECSGKYVLFLNPDTILPEDCLEKSLSFLQAQTTQGALGVRMIDGSGNFLRESKRGFPSPSTSLFKLAGLAKLFPHSKRFARYYLGNLEEHTNQEIDVLAGAFMLITKKVLDIVGGFDEAFFMYGEDIDLSYRIQKAGYTNYYFADSTIIHFKGESTKRGSLNYVRMFHKAMILFVQKHYKKARLFRFLMHVGIVCNALLSGIGSIFKKIFSFSKRKKEKQTLIVANETEFNSLLMIMQKAGLIKMIVGRINNDPAELSMLKAIIKKQAANEIVFCTDSISFKTMIDTVQQIPNAAEFEFYTACGSTIISSSSKDSTGEYILLK